MKRNFNFIRVKVILLLWLAASLAFAAPEHGEVIEGSANITQNANLTTITQHSDQALIEWQTFDIEQAETVEFVQPDSQSLIINNIVGGDTSYIMGELTANGQVVLINQQGFVFTGGSFIQADSLTIAAADLLKDESGNWLLQSTSDHAQILNAGKIEVQNGHLLLMANQIINTGDMINHFGDITAIADQGGFYGLDPTGLTYLALPNEMTNNQATLIDQSGNMYAENGSIDLKVISRNDALDAMLNHQGTSTAGLMDSNEGEMIHFEADNIVIQNEVMADQIDIISKYSLSTNDAKIGFKSSRIELNADSIHIKNSQINAANTHKPGSIKIGGMHLSSDKQASKVIIDRHSILDVSAQNQGDGGDAVVWSKQGTHFTGKIYATGGSQSGDGGFVEISAKQNLHFDGHVDTRAENGNWGTLLLDPDIIIITDGSGGADDAQISGDGATLANEDAMSTYTISEQALEAASATSNISLYATHSIIINDLSDDTLSLAQTGTVTLNVNNSDNTKDNGSAYITMLDKNDTIELTGSGDLEIQASGRTTNLGEVSVDIGNINKLSTGNILITADQIDDGADDNVGRMIISTGDIDVASGGIVFRSDNNDSNVGSQSVDVTVGNITGTSTLYFHLNSLAGINLSTENLTTTLTAGDAIQPLLGSGSGEARFTMNGNFSSQGSGMNIVTDYLLLGSDVNFNTTGSNATSGDINLSGVTTEFNGQSNSLTIETGKLSAVLLDWSKVSNINQLKFQGNIDYSVGNFVASTFNFNQSTFDEIIASSEDVIFSTTENLTSLNLVTTEDVTFISDSDLVGNEILTVTNLSAANTTIGIGVGPNTDLTGLDLGAGALNLVAIDETQSIGFGNALTTDIQFSNFMIQNWNVASITSTNADSYEFSNLDSVLDFTIGDGSQYLRHVGAANSFGSYNANGSSATISADMFTTTGDFNLESISNIQIVNGITSAGSLKINSDENIIIGGDIVLTAEEDVQTSYIWSTDTTDLIINAGAGNGVEDSIIGGMGIGSGNLTINFDENSTGENNLVFNWNVVANNIVINTNGLSADPADDKFTIKQTITANSIIVNDFSEVQIRNDLTILEALDFSIMDVTIFSDSQIQAQSINLGDVNSTTDANLTLISNEAFSINNIDLGEGDLTVELDSDGASGVTNNFITGQIDVGDLNVTAHSSSALLSDDLISFDGLVNVSSLNIDGFDDANFELDITAINDIDFNETALRLTNDININAKQLIMGLIETANNSSVTFNVADSLSLDNIDLENGDLIVNLDENSETVGVVILNGDVIANSILIESHSIIGSTPDDSLTINGGVTVQSIIIDGFSNTAINNAINVVDVLSITGLVTEIGSNITADNFTNVSHNNSAIQITEDSILNINTLNVDSEIQGSSDLTLNMLNPSGAVNIENIILTNSELNILINNTSTVSVNNLGAENIIVSNNNTADLSVGSIVDDSQLNINGFNNVFFTENIIVASIDVEAINNITQTDDTKIEVNNGELNWVAGDDVFITQVESININADSVNITAGNDIIDSNDTQIDFIINNENVLNLIAIGSVDEFEIDYTEVVPPIVVVPVIEGTVIEQIQELAEDALSQPDKDANQTEEMVEKTNEVRVAKIEKSLDAQFDQCDEQDENCKKEKAVKTFLGRLLIGGELPSQ
ncbi:beta strand repeat-containing protein [Marinicellulosiphila megalodicopiae]|uniref:beta strand repeat-containing protein n=1 Tax=Marinicellulosiphila megalodicopiae TaxID=2724896 RepID=UPI003BAFEA53